MKHLAVYLCLALAGCASTKVDISGSADRPPCRPDLSTLVLWTAKWRPDQKDIPERETAAWHGIQKFFIGSSCFGTAEIRSSTALPSDTAAFGRVIAITVRELGPVVRIGLPSLVEGGTEVVIEIKVFDGRTREPLADLRTHWQNGGAFVIKGVGTLEQDMTAALVATFW